MFARTLVTIAAIGIATTAAHALDGTYAVSGTNFDGSSYRGTAEITATSQTTCRIVWTTGSTTSDGICMRHEETFAAAYTLNDSVGLVIYRLGANGVFEGAWTISGVEGSGTETLTPQ